MFGIRPRSFTSGVFSFRFFLLYLAYQRRRLNLKQIFRADEKVNTCSTWVGCTALQAAPIGRKIRQTVGGRRSAEAQLPLTASAAAGTAAHIAAPRAFLEGAHH